MSSKPADTSNRNNNKHVDFMNNSSPARTLDIHQCFRTIFLWHRLSANVVLIHRNYDTIRLNTKHIAIVQSIRPLIEIQSNSLIF